MKYCQAKGIGTILLGDLTGIRKHIDYGKHANQKLHQWAFGKISELITYKAKALGMKVKVIDESYTSQTCPKCGNRKKPTNRNYTCPCGFKYHRDGVGAINIRQKYLGQATESPRSSIVPFSQTRQLRELMPFGLTVRIRTPYAKLTTTAYPR